MDKDYITNRKGKPETGAANPRFAENWALSVHVLPNLADKKSLASILARTFFLCGRVFCGKYPEMCMLKYF
jgi:hypothetical protein